MIACNVEIVEEHRTCMNAPATPYRATCTCGHEITGDACQGCRRAERPGCLTCWTGPDPHECRVEFKRGVPQRRQGAPC
jgi:hypothetical protein